MAGEEHTAINGDGLRERKPREQDEDANSDLDSIPEKKKSDSTFGRTPDGTGRLLCLYTYFGNLVLATCDSTRNEQEDAGYPLYCLSTLRQKLTCLMNSFRRSRDP